MTNAARAAILFTGQKMPHLGAAFNALRSIQHSRYKREDKFMMYTPQYSRRRALIGVSAALVLLLVVACGGGADLADVDLPPSPILLIRANWAVVSSAYAALREAPDAGAAIVSHFRGGEVVEVREKSRFVDERKAHRDYWYLIGVQDKAGWVFGTHLDLYDSREQAVNASVRFDAPSDPGRERGTNDGATSPDPAVPGDSLERANG